MPIHDWTQVDSAIGHHFHHSWIEELKRALNSGVLPRDYYALAEQHAVGFGPDVLTLQGTGNGNGIEPVGTTPSIDGTVLTATCLKPTAETTRGFPRSRKSSTVVVRHVSGDRVVAVIEVVSPSNKASQNPLSSFVDKVAELLERYVHVLVLDLFPPTDRDPSGIHGEIWREISGEKYTIPTDKQLTLASYESALVIRAYVVPVPVGDVLPTMPLFLEDGKGVAVPLAASYDAAFAAVPGRWRRVLERAE